MTMSGLMGAIWLIVCGLAVIFLVRLGTRIAFGNSLEYERNRQRTGGLLTAIRGAVPTRIDGTRDYRVAAGIAVDTRTNEWIEQGRLSTEAVAASLRHPQ